MSQQKAPLSVRFTRIARLASWLWRTGSELRNLTPGDDAQRNRALFRLGQGAIDAIGIELDIHGQEKAAQTTQKGILVVSNHVSWLDIFAMSMLYPSSFIAKQEIKNWPIFGKMGTNAGTVFINRNTRKDIAPINAAITEALNHGRNVSFFPEAQTSLGLSLLPFKAALFQSAIDSGSTIQPLALRYYDINGNRTILPSYAGHMNLFKSLWQIVSMPKLRIRIDYETPYTAAEHPEADRYALKDIAEVQIKNSVLEDSPEKTAAESA